MVKVVDKYKVSRTPRDDIFNSSSYVRQKNKCQEEFMMPKTPLVLWQVREQPTTLLCGKSYIYNRSAYTKPRNKC